MESLEFFVGGVTNTKYLLAKLKSTERESLRLRRVPLKRKLFIILKTPFT